MARTGVIFIYFIYNQATSRCAPCPQGPVGCSPRCLSRRADTGRRQAGSGPSSVFIYGSNRYTNNNNCLLFAVLAAGGPGARLGGRSSTRTPRNWAGRAASVPGEPRWLLPPLLRVGASAAFSCEQAGETIRVRKRGDRRGRDSPGREWASPCARCELAGRGGTIPARRGRRLCHQYPTTEGRI